MGWLVGSTLASMVTAFIVVKIFDYIFAGVTSSVVSVARFPLYVATWTLVTTQAGMQGVSKRMRLLKQIVQRRI